MPRFKVIQTSIIFAESEAEAKNLAKVNLGELQGLQVELDRCKRYHVFIELDEAVENLTPMDIEDAVTEGIHRSDLGVVTNVKVDELSE